jgi:hypothetical protein
MVAINPVQKNLDTPQEIESPSNKGNKSKYIFTIGSIILIFIVILGLFLFRSKSQKQQSQVPTQRAIDLSHTIKTNKETRSQFQTILGNLCKGEGFNGNELVVNVKADELPFMINASSSATIKSYPMYCYFDTIKSRGFGKIILSNEEAINVYDEETFKADFLLGWPELWCRSCNKTIVESDDDTKYKVYIPISDGPQTVKSSSVHIMGEKQINVNDGVIFINFDKIVINAGDSRLITLLSKYKEYDSDKNEYLNRDKSMVIENDIREVFFKDMNNLQKPENTNFSHIKSTLDRIQLAK